MKPLTEVSVQDQKASYTKEPKVQLPEPVDSDFRSLER